MIMFVFVWSHTHFSIGTANVNPLSPTCELRHQDGATDLALDLQPKLVHSRILTAVKPKFPYMFVETDAARVPVTT